MSSPISVVIPSYNGLSLLTQHLPAVLASLRTGDELVIVDDASTDETISQLSKKYRLQSTVVPEVLTDKVRVWSSEYTSANKTLTVTLLQNISNQRFAESVNRGVLAAQHPYILLLNNDVSPHKNLVTQLLSHFEDKKVFAVGCLEHEQHAAKGEAVTGGKNKLWFARGYFQHSRADNFKTGETAWVSGGSGMFDRAKWLELHGFDQAFAPAYWEDVDLSHRARQKGWLVLFDAKAEVDHHHETTNQSVFGQERLSRISWRNAGVFTRKNGTWWQRLQYLLWQPYWWWKAPLTRPSAWVLAVAAILILSLVLRTYQLGIVPDGMTWDEAAIAYNGWSVWSTFKDEWTQVLPISFKSFGDYKAPAIIYGVGLWLKLVELAGIDPMQLPIIRLPFAIAGVLSVAGFMWLVSEVSRRWPTAWPTGRTTLIAGTLLALSPWHLHFSRVGFESGVALFLTVLAMASWWQWQRTRSNWSWMIALICTPAAMYTYHSAKIVLPILVSCWWIWQMKPWKKYVRELLISVVSIGILLLPLGYDTLYGQGSARLSQTSIFVPGGAGSSLASAWLAQWAEHFSPQFWVNGATTTLRHGDGNWGVLYPVTALLALAGVWASRDRKYRAVALSSLGWLLTGLLPASIGQEAPHANRALLALPGALGLAVTGISMIAARLEHSHWNKNWLGTHDESNLVVKSFLGTWLLLHSLFGLAYLHDYYSTFPAASTKDFNDGVYEAAQRAVSYEKTGKVDRVIFSDAYGQPYIYVLAAKRLSPVAYQQGALLNYTFTTEITSEMLTLPRTLVVAAADNSLPVSEADELIYGADQDLKFKLFLR